MHSKLLSWPLCNKTSVSSTWNTAPSCVLMAREREFINKWITHTAGRVVVRYWVRWGRLGVMITQTQCTQKETSVWRLQKKRKHLPNCEVHVQLECWRPMPGKNGQGRVKAGQVQKMKWEASKDLCIIHAALYLGYIRVFGLYPDWQGTLCGTKIE